MQPKGTALFDEQTLIKFASGPKLCEVNKTTLTVVNVK